MKKIAIPAILGVAILVGAVVAIMPVQQASTVHTTLTAEIDGQDRYFSLFVPYNQSDTSILQIVPEDTDNYSGYALIASVAGGAAADGCGLSNHESGSADTSNDFVGANAVATEMANATIPAASDKLVLTLNGSQASQGDDTGVVPGCSLLVTITNLNGN